MGQHPLESLNLPAQVTPFFGRGREAESAKRLLRSNRLLTLTGPGGTGKTRLSLHVAEEIAGEYPDGVHFVPLASIREPELVPSAIAHSVGIREVSGRPPLESLKEHLRARRTLLLLDNCEQIVAAAVQEDVDAIGLSILSGAHNVLFPEIMRMLKEEGAQDIVVFAGGIIPEQDIPKLKALGIRDIFLPGTPTSAAVDAIRSAIK